MNTNIEKLDNYVRGKLDSKRDRRGREDRMRREVWATVVHVMIVHSYQEE